MTRDLLLSATNTYFTTHSWWGCGGVWGALTFSICQFPWCNCCHHGWFFNQYDITSCGVEKRITVTHHHVLFPSTIQKPFEHRS